MYIYAYLRASTIEQDALRAKTRLKEFAAHHGQRIAGWYVENASGASLDRPELNRMLSDMESGDVILIEQVDCSGQLILATRPDCSWNSRSDSFGVKPPLYQWGRMAL